MRKNASASAHSRRGSWNARSLAVRILNRVFMQAAWAEELLEAYLGRAGFNPADNRLCRELTLGVIKMKGFLDWCLEAFCTQRKTPPPRLLNLLRLGAYQLLLLDKIPAHAAVHETVEAGKAFLPLPQLRMLNAVLRAIAQEGRPPLPDRTKDLAQYLAVRYSFPLYIVRRWLERFGEAATEKMMAAANDPPPLWARVNAVLTSPAQVRARLEAQGLPCLPGELPAALQLGLGAFAPADLPGFSGGEWYFQDPAGQMIGWLADPQPGQVCLDWCSAPGGKATHLAELMQGSGKVWAFDVQAAKLKKVADNARRLRLENVETIERVPTALRADRVLVDAPCSGLGTLRRHAEGRWRVQVQDHRRLAQTQLKILQQAARHVRPGGHLVYATCTTEPEENEGVARAFGRQHPDFYLQPGPGSRGIPDSSWWCPEGFFRTYPGFPEMDGMFAARWIKKRSPAVRSPAQAGG
ncbi:16S rRNA (cytosine(967)-C(5))-methyltransferase RsmB [candidate division FCPU426 bacterium]|nr:16S rRNA (cytosine(967)-C(5))-methyltransferase RsmB [candidate division FCPU426 bacterium]